MVGYLSLRFVDPGITLETASRGSIICGVSSVCDVDLRDYLASPSPQTVSRRHFEIVYVPHEGYMIVDLQSLNGTRVNGHLLLPSEPCFLRDGDCIMLAENPRFTIEVMLSDDEQTDQLVPLDRSLEAPRGALEPRHGQLYLRDDGVFVLDSTPIVPQRLTVIEEKLLLYLYERAGRVCPYDEIIRAVWGYTKYDDAQDNTVAKAVSNLRKKLDDISAGAGQRHLQTVRGRGLTCTPV